MERVEFKLSHPLISENHRFDSWMTLCEFVVELAEIEAQRRLTPQLLELTSDIADEIIATVEELELIE